MKHLSVIISLILSCAALAAAADFLILETPSATALYDQYEQRLSRKSLDNLPAGMPFLVISKKQLMGDQITSGMKLSFNGQPYYLMLDEKGQPAGLPKTAGAATISSCQPVLDTVVTATRVDLYKRNPRADRKSTIEKGLLVIRIFGKNGAFYCCIPSNGAYGWTFPSPSAFVKPTRKPSASPEASTAELHGRIVSRLTAANAQYDTLFSYFSRHAGVHKSAPQWTFAISGNVFVYTMQASTEIVSQLEQSTRYLVNDIERIIAGKPFTVTSTSGIITVRLREK